MSDGFTHAQACTGSCCTFEAVYMVLKNQPSAGQPSGDRAQCVSRKPSHHYPGAGPGGCSSVTFRRDGWSWCPGLRDLSVSLSGQYLLYQTCLARSPLQRTHILCQAALLRNLKGCVRSGKPAVLVGRPGLSDHWWLFCFPTDKALAGSADTYTSTQGSPRPPSQVEEQS
jgi:hypothetical protein